MSEAWASAGAEARRLAIVRSYRIGPDVSRQLDRLAALAARLCEAPVGIISLTEADRQRFIGRSGTDRTEAPRAADDGDTGFLSDERTDAGGECGRTTAAAVPGARFHAGEPLRSLESAPIGTLCVIDTKPRDGLTNEQREGLRTLARAAMDLLERERLEGRRQAEAARSKTVLHDLEQRFRVLADAMPQMVWSALASGRADYFNRVWCDYTGAPAAVSYGDGWTQFLHPEDTEIVAQAWRAAVETSGTYETEYRLRGADGEYRWMLVRGLPMLDEQEKAYRWLGTCTDVHEQKAASEQDAVLTRELSHRIKNIFAVISGLITLSLRRKPELEQLGRELQQRVLALGRAHDFVRPHSEQSRSHHSHCSLHGMLDSLLGAYQAAPGERIAVRGADVRIDDRSSTPLALFFHELATNAAKYGALTTDEGRVEIAIDTDARQGVTLTWSESGGPPIAGTPSPGFGASLIEMSVTRQLGGRLEHDWRAEGLRVRAAIPAKAMAR